MFVPHQELTEGYVQRRRIEFDAFYLRPYFNPYGAT